MNASFTMVLLSLLIGIAMIVLLTARFHIHAFFALLIAAFVVGIGVQMPLPEIIATIKTGFGHIMSSLGFIIVLGTALGVLLEHTGSTQVMATQILKRTGNKHAPLAMSLTGFIVGLPIFCDSGYIVLSGLNSSVTKRTGIAGIIMSVCLASGLYAVHCLLPPHPGATAAAVALNVDPGKLIGIGLIVALPAMIAGYAWALYAGKRIETAPSQAPGADEQQANLPAPIMAFLPVVIPILLIAVKSFLPKQAEPNFFYTALNIFGDPVIALSVGIFLAFAGRGWKKKRVSALLQESAEKAGGILVIIGAGGAFGAVLAATKIGTHVSSAFDLGSIGIVFPFLLAFILKTAQGSSTVAIITAASIVHPLLPALQLDNGNGPLFAVLSMGAGSMMISHANDAYFWVIAKFSDIAMKPMLKVYSVASIIMGVISFIAIYLLFIIMR